MKLGPTLLLKAAVLAITAFVLMLCIFALPEGIMDEGADAYAPLFYGLYATTIPFFIAVYQGWKLLTYVDKNQAFSAQSVKALQNIKYCALTISAMYALGSPYLFVRADVDDAPGVFAMGLMVIFASFIIGTFAGVLQKLLQDAIAMKSENDLTV